MRAFKSIKWRLQIWYGLVLVAVLAGFGVTAWQLERGRIFRRADDELLRRFGILAEAAHPPPRLRGRGGPFEGPPDRLPGDPPEDNFIPPRTFALPPQAVGLFDANDPNHFYFIIEGGDGRVIAHSENVPEKEIEFQHQFHRGSERRDPRGSVPDGPAPHASLIASHARGIFRRLPSGEAIFVGCSVEPELRELNVVEFTLAAVGGGILLLGLAGGWWIAGRAIRPVQDIGAAAVKISAGNLSQRISTAETESELGQLAGVLNSTFARLEAAFTQQQQFTSDAAHELRTPVSVMLTQTQSALSRERSAAEYRETIEACQRAARRMRRLIESLLELARLDAGQEPLKRLQFDLSKIVRDGVELVKPLADERGVKIICELAPLKIVGDAERLAQVITNLLTNAIQYNKPGGEVRVTLAPENQVAALSVSDTGIGIAPEDLPRVFERFYRADKSRSTGGNGLGLAISKAIVEAHGGIIQATQLAGSGTAFTVRMPITTA